MSLDVYLESPKEPSPIREVIFVREDGGTRELSRAEWDERYPGVEPVTVEAQTPAPTADTTVQDLALNGAQVSSLLEIITAVSSGTLPAATAREVIASAFPSFDAARIDRMLSPLSAFVPAATPQAPAAPPPALDTQPSVTDGQPA